MSIVNLQPRRPDAQENGLRLLEDRIREELAYINYPPKNWVPETVHPVHGKVSDVVIVGAGMCGLAAAFAMRQIGLLNFRMLDGKARGTEGPWIDYARMETLRSEKTLIGPSLRMASLTFRAWYTAQHGVAGWEALGRIPRPLWMDYLTWYRTVLDLPVENGVRLTRIEPFEGVLKLHVEGAAQPFILTRKLVLATGRNGLGGVRTPELVAALPRHLWAHSIDPIDFARLAGKRVVVVGASASAMDNAATALENGAAEARILARRPKMLGINKMRAVGVDGFTYGYPALSPEWQWKIKRYTESYRSPAPRPSVLRVSRHPNAYFHFSFHIERIEAHGDTAVIVAKDGRRIAADLIITATGFDVDVARQAEIADFAEHIALWRDRLPPAIGDEDEELERYPFLGPSFEFLEKTPGAAPFLKDIHCFNHGATMSLGRVSSDIPQVSDGAVWLAHQLASTLFVSDVERHWQAILAYEDKELYGDEYRDADAADDLQGSIGAST
ncbi:NAD(P)/FAD-dependent oxidoreductase [Ancylobacter sonchi]|uniref:NAD(P)-binding domain-containing protein n=1 Tax=Ancylobacter sonchi TaxID=1937790 RepID=UPI0035E41F37